MKKVIGRKTNFLICPVARRNRRLDESQIRRLLYYLGGEPTASGFAFASDRRRQAAWEVLCEQFGSGYFEKLDELVGVAG